MSCPLGCPLSEPRKATAAAPLGQLSPQEKSRRRPLVAARGRERPMGSMYAWEESHEQRLARLHREHEQFMKSLRRGRYPLFTLLFAWGL